MKPMGMSHEELATFLRWLADEVEAHDSYEGSLSYEIPEDPMDDFECMVMASVRFGNLEGQGSVRLIGLVE